MYDIKNQKMADIIVPHHDRHDMLEILLGCLDKSIFNIIVVSGGSFAENCNRGALAAGTDKLIFMNDDIYVNTDQLIKMSNALDLYDYVGTTQIAGIVNKKKYWGIGLFKNPDGSIRHQISTDRHRGLLPSGFCFGFNRKKWEKIKGFNQNFKTGNEDVDLGLRCLELGFKFTILDLEIAHKESQSTGRFKYVAENEDLFYSIWREKLPKFLNAK